MNADEKFLKDYNKQANILFYFRIIKDTEK